MLKYVLLCTLIPTARSYLLCWVDADCPPNEYCDWDPYYEELKMCQPMGYHAHNPHFHNPHVPHSPHGHSPHSSSSENKKRDL